ncbi:hypothetical protein K438DRAFT_1969680 [Mycena galopus ATCC 62051]|nr:hypothetical protein K438DRAFT_1969680 [Mycena galopus ATCC 62051]
MRIRRRRLAPYIARMCATHRLVLLRDLCFPRCIAHAGCDMQMEIAQNRHGSHSEAPEFAFERAVARPPHPPSPRLALPQLRLLDLFALGAHHDLVPSRRYTTRSVRPTSLGIQPARALVEQIDTRIVSATRRGNEREIVAEAGSILKGSGSCLAAPDLSFATCAVPIHASSSSARLPHLFLLDLDLLPAFPLMQAPRYSRPQLVASETGPAIGITSGLDI